MTEHVSTAGLSDRAFKPLDRHDFLTLEQAPSLKGLLQPFTGKGDMARWAEQCEALRDDLIQLARRRLLPQLANLPFRSLGIELAQQSTAAGTTFWRWRKVDRSAMSVALWDELIVSARTPDALAPDLLRIECQRATVNMQISMTHSLARHARVCADRLAHAEAACLRRRPPFPTIPQESS